MIHVASLLHDDVIDNAGESSPCTSGQASQLLNKARHQVVMSYC